MDQGTVRILSTIPNTPDEVSGVPFVKVADALHVSGPLDPDGEHAQRFARMSSMRLFDETADAALVDMEFVDAQLRKRAARPSAREAVANQTVVELQDANRRMSADLYTRGLKIEELSEQLAAAEGKGKGKISELDARCEGLEREKASLQGQLADVERSARAATQGEVDTLTTRAEVAEQAVETKAAEISRLTDERTSFEQRIAGLEQEKAALTTSVSTLTADNAALTTKVTGLEKQVGDLTAAAAKAGKATK